MMGLSWILFLVAVVFFTYRGYRRGFGASLSRIFGLVTGYLLAILFTPQLASWLQVQTNFEGVVTYVVAGLILFFGGGFVVSVLFSVLLKVTNARKSLSFSSALGGAATGLVVGCVVGLALVWGVVLFRQLQPLPELPKSVSTPLESTGEQAPIKKPNAIEKIAGRLAGGAAAVAVQAMDAGPEVAQATQALVQSPGETVQSMQRLFRSEELKSLLDDPNSQALLQRGDTQALIQLPAFKRLYQHQDLNALAQMSGVTDNSEEALAEHLSELWRRGQHVKHNPELQKILQDPKFRKQLESGNPAVLLTNPKIQSLAKIIYSAGTGDLPSVDDNDSFSPHAAEVQSDIERKPPTEDKTQVHRWVDSEGRVHFTDKKPKE